MWLVAVVGRYVVGCEQCSRPTTQRPTTATNHIQQNQSSVPYAVTLGLCSPEDGHNDARNMLRQKLIINIRLLHLFGFFSIVTKYSEFMFPLHSVWEGCGICGFDFGVAVGSNLVECYAVSTGR